jgi:hypothetical protein
MSPHLCCLAAGAVLLVSVDWIRTPEDARLRNGPARTSAPLLRSTACDRLSPDVRTAWIRGRSSRVIVEGAEPAGRGADLQWNRASVTARSGPSGRACN